MKLLIRKNDRGKVRSLLWCDILQTMFLGEDFSTEKNLYKAVCNI
jgi:hypothetical protein